MKLQEDDKVETEKIEKKNQNIIFISGPDLENDKNVADLLNALKNLGVEIKKHDETTSEGLTSQENSPKPNFDLKAINVDGDSIELSKNEANFEMKMLNFFKPTRIIDKGQLEDLYHYFHALDECERLFIAFLPRQEDYKPLKVENDNFLNSKILNLEELEKRYKKFKIDHLSKNTKFIIIRDPEIANKIGIYQDDIPDFYMIKKSSIWNNFDSNVRIDGIKLQYNKVDITDENSEEMKKLKLKDKDPYISRLVDLSCLDHVNLFQTQFELENMKRIAQRLQIKKILVVSTPRSGEDLQKLVSKLVKAKKELRRDDFMIMLTNNFRLAQNEFNITSRRKTIDDIRYIDLSKIKIWKAPENIKFEVLNQLETSASKDEESEKISDQNSSMVSEDYGINLRYSFEEKPTKRRIKEFLTQALNSNLNHFYETETNLQNYHSKYIHEKGSTFENDVLLNEKHVFVEFYKPSCPSCKILSPAYEEFAKIVKEIQEYIIESDRLKREHKPYEDNAVNKYKILHPRKFLNVEIARYSIYNESPVFPSPAGTPLIFIFKSNRKTKPEPIDLIAQQIKITDTERVVKILLRIVDENL